MKGSQELDSMILFVPPNLGYSVILWYWFSTLVQIVIILKLLKAEFNSRRNLLWQKNIPRMIIPHTERTEHLVSLPLHPAFQQQKFPEVPSLCTWCSPGSHPHLSPDVAHSMPKVAEQLGTPLDPGTKNSCPRPPALLSGRRQKSQLQCRHAPNSALCSPSTKPFPKQVCRELVHL